MTNKISLIGRAGVGKTSILKLLFEGGNPHELLNSPLAPTRGNMAMRYSWMDLELSIFDTSGQELSFLLKDEYEQAIVLNKTDIVIYIVDQPSWIQNSNEIIEEIKKIFNILRTLDISLVILFHKIDLIEKIGNNLQLMKSGLRSKLNLPGSVSLYFTSIHPDLDFTIFNSFFEILSRLSSVSIDLKEIIDKIIKDQPKMICFITNDENYIIVQSMTGDFNTDLIYKVHIAIRYYVNSIDVKGDFQQDIKSIGSGVEILKLIVCNLIKVDPYLKSLVIFSENQNIDELIKFKDNLKNKIENYYK